MKCPQCGGAELVKGLKNVPYTWQGNDTVLKDIMGLHCPDCGEVVLNKEESAALRVKIVEFKNSLTTNNTNVIEPEYIVSVRKKLGLSQAAAGVIFGGGKNGFCRYELGKAKPHPSTVRLLKLLDRHPDLLNEIR
ncbi:type II TA system antitoxin MqsA family protein [Pectobacterium aroidearum]|uniref:type II TA system antitoxin MqsA family protein n=1 Tax=Pectobacterium aroidearum TaxID=1201031 RepID=UPI0031594465